MSRYFIEVAYRGTDYSGFQVQQNANSVQSEIERALKIFLHRSFTLTGASRTDAGVHALQNFFHFDILSEGSFSPDEEKMIRMLNDTRKSLYSLNSLLPHDIVIKKIARVADTAHCRFDAREREYKYYIYKSKDPFLRDRAYYFPFKTDMDKLNEAAGKLPEYDDFTSFCKRHTQVNNFYCSIYKSQWTMEDTRIVYTVSANRFLRGMVRGLVGTMLRAGTGKISIREFCDIIESRDCRRADFSVPAHGLFLTGIKYPFSM